MSKLGPQLHHGHPVVVRTDVWTLAGAALLAASVVHVARRKPDRRKVREFFVHPGRL